MSKSVLWRVLYVDERVAAVKAARAGLNEDAAGTDARASHPPPGLRLSRRFPCLAVMTHAFAGAATDEMSGGAPLAMPSPIAAGFLAWARADLERIRERIAVDPIEWRRFEPVLIRSLSATLSAVAARTLVLEVHVAQTLGGLDGKTGFERYLSFARTLDVERAYRALLVRRAGLTRLMSDCCLAWHHDTMLLAECWQRDRTELERWLGEPATLTSEALSVATPIGYDDWPRPIVRCASGRTVLFLRRNNAVRDFVARALASLCARLDEAPLGMAPAFPAGDAAWIAAPATREPQTEEGRRRFSYRLGLLLGGLHVLGVTGLRHTDVLIDDTEPVLLHVETMMRNDPAIPDGSIGPAETFLLSSVLRTGLLGGDTQERGTAMAVRHLGQGTFSYAWSERLEIDEAKGPRLVREPVRWTSIADTHPLIAEEVVRGFARIYQCATELFTAGVDGFPRPEGDIASRHSIRTTDWYLQCLRIAEHPDNLGSAVDRQLAIRRLISTPDTAMMPPAVLEAEVDALVRGRIPRFDARPLTRDLVAPDGTIIADYFPRTAVDASEERLAGFGAADLARQATLIRWMLAGSKSQAPVLLDQEIESGGIESREPLLDAAILAGDWICGIACQRHDVTDWFGLQDDDWSRARIRPAGPDLYHGTAGIATFLAYLARQSGERRFMDVALSAIRGAAAHLSAESHWPGGAFSGRGSVVFGALHVASAAAQPDLLASVLEASLTIGQIVRPDLPIDIVGGAAGLISVLLAVHRATGEAVLLERVATLADHVCRRSVPASTGRTWTTALAEEGLAGFAHGAAGITWALAHAATATGMPDWDETIRDGLRFERSLYSAPHRNWRDMRKSANDVEHAALAWCHGAPGIGIARATLPDAYLGVDEREDLSRALAAVESRSWSGETCLCHGELGNLDLLLLASARLEMPSLLETARQRGARVAWRILGGAPWRCGINSTAPTPGLLVGVAGIGFGLLRLRDPEGVPSLLSVQAPPAGSSRFQ